MLLMSTATATLVVTIPVSCIPVLFAEIADELGLTLVQIGAIWGAASLAGVFVSPVAGAMGDRFGILRVVSLSCVLMGAVGALRGLSTSFFGLAISMFGVGVLRAVLPVNLVKAIGVWFRGGSLGLANGVLSMGMGLGLMLGPLLSASLLSPALGGWRVVLFVYAAVAVLMGLIWFRLRAEPRGETATHHPSATAAFRRSLTGLLRVRAVWLLGLTLMFRAGTITGMSGYLPLYLRGEGWPGVSADRALAVFYGFSTLSVIPLSLLSDRIGSRKVILFPALLMTLLCLGLLPFVQDRAVWLLVAAAGVFFDVSMALTITMLLETEGLESAHSGIAVGMVFAMSQLGGFVAAPAGNSLAAVDPGAPLVFWASLSVASALALSFVGEASGRVRRTRDLRRS